MTHGRHIRTITKTSVCAKSLEQQRPSMRDGKYIATLIHVFLFLNPLNSCTLFQWQCANSTNRKDGNLNTPVHTDACLCLLGKLQFHPLLKDIWTDVIYVATTITRNPTSTHTSWRNQALQIWMLQQRNNIHKLNNGCFRLFQHPLISFYSSVLY